MENLASKSTSTATFPSESAPPACSGLVADALVAAGLKRVTAYVRDKASANAERVKRSREKLAESGVAQVNVRVPIALHQTIKDVANALQTKGDARQALEASLLAEVKSTFPHGTILVCDRQELEAFREFSRRMNGLSGWRQQLARLLGIF